MTRRKDKNQPGQPSAPRTPPWKPLLFTFSLVLVLAAIVYWALEIRKPSSYAVCLTGFNHTEQAVASFSVNGHWGGNISHMEPGDLWGGGGSRSCGITLAGETATVKWKYGNKTREDVERGVPMETHEVTVPMPEAQSNHSRYFQVHIFPDHHVELQLNDSPFSDEQVELLRPRVQKMQEEYLKQHPEKNHE